jgi:hypothetical protein
MAPQQRDADARSRAAMPGTKLDRHATIRVRAKLEAAGGSNAMVRSSLAVRKQFFPERPQTKLEIACL